MVGTDIAELLLEGRNQSGQDYALCTSRTLSVHSRDTDSEEREADGAVDNDILTTTSSRTVLNAGRSATVGSGTMNIDELTERFRYLLLKGHKRV